MKPLPLPARTRRAFTILEVLVATAVLALMLTLAVGLIDSADKSTRSADRRLDTASMVRLAFDRMAADLSTLLWDGEVTLIVGKSNSTRPETAISDSFAFLCKARTVRTDYTSGGYPRLSSIAYMIGRHTNENLGFTDVDANDKPLMLTRIVRDIQWSKQLPEELAAMDANINYGFEDITQSSVSFRAIGEGVIRMAVVVHLEDGTILPADSPNLPELSTFSIPNSQRMDKDVSRPLDLSKISAITVGLAVLDMKSQVLSVNDLYALAAKLPRPGNGELPVEAWTDVSWNDQLSERIARANLRFYQRTFPIPTR